MGRSIQISITSTTLSSFAVHLANMTKVLAFILLGLVAIVLSENAEDQSGEIDNIRSDNYLELNREIREADPGKKNKNGKNKSQKKKGRKAGKKKRKGGKKAIKGGKKNKKGGKKARKVSKKAGGKKKRKRGKKSSKSKLGKKKRKGSKKARKGQMNSGKPSVNGDGRSLCPRTVNSTCLDVAIKLMNIVNKKITNFLVQQKRMTKFNSTGGKKQAKKGLFAPIANKIIDIGGGNASDLSCSGNKTNPGAKKLKEIITNLKSCEDKIKSACDPSAYPLPNKTEADACKTNMESMKTKVEACSKKSGSEACTCWLDSELKAVADKVKKCDISSENKKVTTIHKQCTGNFSACKKVEDTAVTYIYACSQSADDLKVKAAQTKKNVDALKSAKEKTEKLAGSSSGNSTFIRKRQTSITTCSYYVTMSAKLLVIAQEAVTSSALETMAKVLAAVSDSLSCSTDEKSSLKTQVKTYTVSIEIVTATYNGLKTSIEDASGSTSDAEIEAAGEAASSSTKATSSKRNRLVRNILNNLN